MYLDLRIFHICTVKQDKSTGQEVQCEK